MKKLGAMTRMEAGTPKEQVLMIALQGGQSEWSRMFPKFKSALANGLSPKEKNERETHVCLKQLVGLDSEMGLPV